MSTQHDDFLEGFGDALGLTDRAEIEAHYRRWLLAQDMNAVELIDYESGGYETGLETGDEYKEEHGDFKNEDY